MADTLSRLKSLAKPIRVAIIGAGHTGKALLYQCGITPGIECVALADIKVDKAVGACAAFGCAHRVVKSLPDLHDSIARGAIGVAEDGELLARICAASSVESEIIKVPHHGSNSGYAENLAPLIASSKCRWGPLELPVLPKPPMYPP